ncbi:MAG: hypothetical protein WD738_23805 [Pirellulales bacterium]
MNHRIHPPIWLAALSTIVVGCGAPEEPLADTKPTVAKAPAVADKPSQPVAKSAKSAEPAAAASPSSAVAQFSPPFPDRLELFEPPKRAQGTVRRDDEHGETVELKGFVHVDEPRVVLSIDGVISPIAEGGEKYGVHVISIQPPSVVLQRGRNRWTATLE